MPKQPPVPKRAPAIPLSGPIGSAFPDISSLSPKKRVRSDAPFYAETQANADAEAREDIITRYFFYAYMLLTFLGIAAMGYALMAM